MGASLMVAPLKLLANPAADAGDAPLVLAVRRGDRAASSALYLRHVDAVRRIVARLVGVGVELDDLVQDAFVTAFRRLSSLREPAAFAAWLYAVAVGVARHLLRQKARRRWLSFLAPEDVPEVEAPAPALVDGTRDAARAASVLLAELPVDLRIAFSLRR
ncbi:MAG TPA: RNA polymerase sigma factor, partial [Myxococcota bacterium]